MDKVQPFFISTPYIDAYQEPGILGAAYITFKEFEKRMQNQAWQWGEQSIGRRLLKGETPAMNGEEYVLAFGTHGAESYIMVQAPGREMELVELEKYWNWGEWDVT